MGLEFKPIFLSNSIDNNARKILIKPPLTNNDVVTFIKKKYFQEKDHQINNVEKYFKQFNIEI
ncbi:MAG: hypothetical protein ACERKN_16710 [Velocimicrobium sp.]